jgi:hypothetical protein
VSDQPRGIRVTVEDLATGEVETIEVPVGEYFIATVEPCYVSYQQVFGAGKTVQLTIKGRVLR